ncbi:TRAP transporter substrate-binding protein [Salicibibacter kimchii]|uniref:C4-dicarboxylate ABC transporter substrate-binding protein n=1 Tax=Salicibibacter kimchii TaxID=2099786 RepID=A0A345C189_9BACI|nr:TRAP transporter substrate-binding protein [Salicibibacter kimchii]AXF56970.1 C4-dicarboxylate ABC transporter substrate-binding protein [Salicibibacter kimchii]
MKKYKSLFYTMTLAGLMSVMAACGGSDEEAGSEVDEEATADEASDEGSEPDQDAEEVFSLTLITEESHMWHQAALVFQEELEERSDGRFSLETYPAGQLGSEADMLQQIESGSIDFGFITAAEVSSREEAFSAWLAPYLFETIEEAHEARQSEEAIDILDTLEGSNMLGLDYLFAGQRMMLFADEEVTGAEDMSGLTLRVTPSPAMLHFYNSAGASTEGMPLTEVYSAVQQGVIDGMDMDLDATITNNFAEVVDYGAVTNHMVWPSVAIVSEQTMEGLSEEDQQIVQDSLEVAADYSAETRAAQEEEFIEELEDQGMEMYEIDQEAFEDQIEDFDEEFAPQDPLIESFINAHR